MALVRAIPLMDFRATALSTTGVSTGYSFPPSTSTGATQAQLVYGGLHLSSGFASTTRIMSMVIQSASSSGFTAATARITFTLSTATPNAQWGTPAAQSTDQPWWRASWTLSTATTTSGTWKGLVHFGQR